MPLTIISFSYCTLVCCSILLGHRRISGCLYKGTHWSPLPACCYPVFLQPFPGRNFQPGYNVCILPTCLINILCVLSATPERSSRTETPCCQASPFTHCVTLSKLLIFLCFSLFMSKTGKVIAPASLGQGKVGK